MSWNTWRGHSVLYTEDNIWCRGTVSVLPMRATECFPVCCFKTVPQPHTGLFRPLLYVPSYWWMTPHLGGSQEADGSCDLSDKCSRGEEVSAPLMFSYSKFNCPWCGSSHTRWRWEEKKTEKHGWSHRRWGWQTADSGSLAKRWESQAAAASTEGGGVHTYCDNVRTPSRGNMAEC